MYVGGEIADLARIGRPADRRGHRGPAGPPRADRLARGDRGGQGRAARGAARRTARPILNADDPIVRRMGRRTAARSLTLRVRRRRRRRGPRASTRAGLDGMRFTLRADGGRADRSRSRPWAGCRSTTRSPAAAVGPRRRADPRRDRRRARGPAGPRRIASSSSGCGGVTVVDDTLQRLARSVVAALDLLAGLPGRRGAVLGEMLELGEARDEGHRVVGEAAARTVDWLVVVGAGAPRDRRGRGRGRAWTRARDRPGRPMRRRPSTLLVPRLRDGDVVLVKASRGIAPRARRRRSPARARRGARPMTVELIQGLLLAFALMVILMSPYIRLLHALGLRQAHPRRRVRRATTSRRGRRRWAAS